jgi:hypothetical protein
VINPDHPTKWQSGVSFDQLAAIVIGSIAVISALLGLVHTDRSLEAGRANQVASRLAADVSARIAVASVGSNLSYNADEAVLMLGMEGTDTALAALQANQAGALAVGQAMYNASGRLKAALAATEATSGGSPADGYAASLLGTTPAQFQAELAEQSREIDISTDAGAHDRNAVLGLSFMALAGVLTGLAAALREGRAGWIALRTAGALVVLAAGLTLLAIF